MRRLELVFTRVDEDVPILGKECFVIAVENHGNWKGQEYFVNESCELRRGPDGKNEWYTYKNGARLGRYFDVTHWAYCPESIPIIASDNLPVYQKIKKGLHVAYDVDGFLYFYPSKDMGGFTAEHLREIANGLDADNEPWRRQIATDPQLKEKP